MEHTEEHMQDYGGKMTNGELSTYKRKAKWNNSSTTGAHQTTSAHVREQCQHNKMHKTGMVGNTDYTESTACTLCLIWGNIMEIKLNCYTTYHTMCTEYYMRV